MFDLLCGLCIVRMVLLHCISMCGHRGEFWFGKLMAWTFFFICFFFFKAGYFNKGTGGPTLPYLRDRARRLLLPYATWGAAGSVVYFGFLLRFPLELGAYARQLRWAHVWGQSHFYGDPPLWFLFSFFATFLLVHLMGKARVPLFFAVAFPAASWWLWREGNPLWMSLDNVFMGVYYFCLGKWWRRVRDTLPRGCLALLSALMVAAFVAGNHLWHGEYDMSLNNWVQRPLGAVGNSTLALCGLSGLLLAARTPRVPWLCFVGEHSMVYFVLHYPLLLCYTLIHASWRRAVWGHWDDFILVSVIVFCVCSWAVPFVERVPWLSGRYNDKARSAAPGLKPASRA